MPSPKRITFIGPVNSFTGYGLHSLAIIKDLQRLAPAYVSVRPITQSEMFGSRIPTDIRALFVNQPQPEPWEILLHPPSFLPTPGKRTLYFSMWESTKLPPVANRVLNRAEVVVVPSQWNASCFSACGITPPIRVVPLGIRTEIFGYRPFPDNPKCVFGAAGRMAHGGVRKGINEVIALFKKAFPQQKDVELRVKCFPDCDVSKVKDPRVKVTQAYLSDGQMSDWYGGLTCFVSAAKAEGWGLMQHQALAMGRPVISINYGGVAEFMRDDIAYIVPHKLERASGVYDGCGHWAEPDEDAMIEQMRRVYKNRLEAIEKGVRAAEAVVNLSWENSNRALLKVMKEFKIV